MINEVGHDLPSVPNEAPPLINVFNICNLVSSARFKADTPNTGTTDMDVAKFFNGSLGLRVRNFLTTVSSCLHLFLLARVSIIITTFSRPNEPKLFGISVKKTRKKQKCILAQEQVNGQRKFHLPSDK